MSKRPDLEDIPLLDEGRHQQVDVVWLVEVVTHTVRQGADSVIQDQQVLENKNISINKTLFIMFTLCWYLWKANTRVSRMKPR